MANKQQDSGDAPENPRKVGGYGLAPEQLAGFGSVFRPDLFAGRVVVVSGAAGGIGRAIAALYARLGASLVICGRTQASLDDAAAFLRRLGAPVLVQAMDIREPEQADALMQAAWQHYGRLDVLVNNAGGQFAAPAIDFTPRGWKAVIDTNLNGSWFMMQAAARLWMREQAPGNVVNIVATVWRGRPTVAHTCAARAGVIYLSKTLAVEWAPAGIRVNCVAPGVIETEAFVRYPPAGLATYRHDANAMRHPGDAFDIAEACAYLSAPSGKFITGEVLTVDGGQQLWGDPWPAGRPAYFDRRD